MIILHYMPERIFHKALLQCLERFCIRDMRGFIPHLHCHSSSCMGVALATVSGWNRLVVVWYGFLRRLVMATIGFLLYSKNNCTVSLDRSSGLNVSFFFPISMIALYSLIVLIPITMSLKGL